MSVSSEKHLPIFDVAPTSIPEYVNLMKSKGYIIIALEQTNNAVDL